MLNGKNEPTMDILMSKKEILRRLNTLRIKPSGLKERKYGISVKYFSGNEQIPSKRIDYDVNVNLSLEYNKGTLTIHKENIYYNQHQPDSINEILGDSISKALYPLQISINEKGLTTNEILNHKEIISRWEFEKQKILQNHQSDSLYDFFVTADQRFSDKTGLQRSLKNDWFWNLFFHSKFINYGDTRNTETSFHLSVVPYRPPLKFTGIQLIHKIPTKYHSFIIEFNSVEMAAHHYFTQKKHTGQEYFMSLKVIYDMDIYHHFPMHIQAYFEVYSKDWAGNKIFIKRINYTQFQENTEEYKDQELDKTSPFITGGVVVSEPNKWGFYKNTYENDW